MKIAFLISSLSPRGPVFVVRNLVGGLSARGHQCEIFYFDEPVRLEVACPTHRISFGEMADFSRFDIVHSHGLRPNLYLTLRIPNPDLRRYRVLSTIHSYAYDEFMIGYGPLFGRLLHRLFVFSLKRLDGYVALSEDMRKYLSRWLPEKKLYSVANGIGKPLRQDESLLSKIDAFFAPGDIRLVCHSALVTLKHVAAAIHGLSHLPSHFKLWVNGDGTEADRLKRLVRRLSLHDRVYFAGEIPREAICVGEMDVFLQCAASEGFCLSMVEAMALGVAVVSSDIPGMRERFGGECVTYYPFSPDDAESGKALAAAVLRAVDEPGKRIMARQQVESRFTISAMASGYESVYQTLTSMPSVNQKNQ